LLGPCAHGVLGVLFLNRRKRIVQKVDRIVVVVNLDSVHKGRL
jgi:hypothetical protein